MNSKFLIAAAAGLAMSLSAGSASAISVVTPDVLITITSTGDGALPPITFEVPEDPTPASYGSLSFTLDDIAVTDNGAPAGTESVTFYSSGFDGGLSDPTYFDLSGGITGDQIFGGTEQMPTFTPGSTIYSGTYYSDRTVSGLAVDPVAEITISALATPLPSTWLMLLSGLVGLAYFTRRGTNKRSPIHAA